MYETRRQTRSQSRSRSQSQDSATASPRRSQDSPPKRTQLPTSKGGGPQPPTSRRSRASSPTRSRRQATRLHSPSVSPPIPRGHSNQPLLPRPQGPSRLSDKDHRVKEVVGKRRFEGETYYKLEWADNHSPSYVLDKDCRCRALIKKYESNIRDMDDKDDIWEVDEVLDKRVNEKNEVEYLVRWKDWPGEPTWEPEANCNCINLIAAFENPKLRRMWRFTGNNRNLWASRETVHDYMKEYLKAHPQYNDWVHLIPFRSNLPTNEEPNELKTGLNIGALKYEHHWYLILILINHLGYTKKILIADALNTTLGVDIFTHPVTRRLQKVYGKNFPIRGLGMTLMDRSDVCAFYLIGAFERALFIFSPRARYHPSTICVNASRCERIRSRMLPHTDKELSASLPVSAPFDGNPRCEFCNKRYDYFIRLDRHIQNRHFIRENDSDTSRSTNSSDTVIY